jgi:hypothetical protein
MTLTKDEEVGGQERGRTKGLLFQQVLQQKNESTCKLDEGIATAQICLDSRYLQSEDESQAQNVARYVA